MHNDIPVRRITVTPTTARTWLEFNTHNRPISETTVQAYLRDMLAGRWLFTGDPIRFSEDGALLDGQHRLHALSRCPDGIECDFLVITKLPRDTQMAMDQGRRRSPGDQLSLLGAKGSATVAAGIRRYLAFTRGFEFRDSKVKNLEVSTMEVQEWFAKNPNLVEQASSINVRCSDAPPSISYCAALMFIQAYGLNVATEFFRLLGAGAGEGHPINTLDKRLQRIRRTKTRASDREYLALFIQAMNAWREGRTVTKFQMPEGSKWTAENFPKLRVVS